MMVSIDIFTIEIQDLRWRFFLVQHILHLIFWGILPHFRSKKLNSHYLKAVDRKWFSIISTTNMYACNFNTLNEQITQYGTFRDLLWQKCQMAKVTFPWFFSRHCSEAWRCLSLGSVRPVGIDTSKNATNFGRKLGKSEVEFILVYWFGWKICDPVFNMNIWRERINSQSLEDGKARYSNFHKYAP